LNFDLRNENKESLSGKFTVVKKNVDEAASFFRIL